MDTTKTTTVEEMVNLLKAEEYKRISLLIYPCMWRAKRRKTDKISSASQLLLLLQSLSAEEKFQEVNVKSFSSLSPNLSNGKPMEYDQISPYTVHTANSLAIT